MVGVYYGNQEVVGEKQIRDNLDELFIELNRHKDEGRDCLVAGDYNLKIGCRVKGNDDKVSKGGKYLIDLCNEFGFDFANNLAEGPTHTHFDATSKTSRVLDLVLTNSIEKHKELKVDNELIMTPYRVRRTGKDQTERKYTDHISVYGEVEVKYASSNKSIPKVTRWRTHLKGARVDYQNETDRQAERLLDIIEKHDNSDEMLEQIYKLIDEIKMKVFGLQTITVKKIERTSDEKLLLQRVKEIEKANDDMLELGKKINEKIFIAKKKACDELDDGLLEAIDHYKTGERLENVKDIWKSLMDYNVEVLEKNKPRNKEAEEARTMKKESVEFFELVESDFSEQDLTWKEYMAVVNKVALVNKNCYKDFTWAGPKWQTAMFLMFKKIYRSEQIPREFLKTKLKKLYKKKGSKNKLSSYRFIHLKDWAGKMMEKMIVQKSQEHINNKMPDMQIGGMRNSSTIEHILTALTVAKIKTREGSGASAILIDCMKCFDKQLLTDCLHSVSSAGITGKRLRMIKKIHDETEISLVGDPTNQTAIITNSTGQGSNFAPTGCGLSMAQSIMLETNAQCKNKITVGNKAIDPLMFVDDLDTLVETHEAAKESCIATTKALDNLGLEAHPEKSAIVIMGSKKYKEKMRQRLIEDPCKVQDFELKESDLETYLGVQFSGKGVKDSVNESIKLRIRKTRVKMIQLMKALEDELVEKQGWLEAVKVLFNSIIVPTLTYGCQAFANMTNKQESELEMCMKDVLYKMLGISKYSHYASVLMECNMIRLKHIMNKLKIGFLNDLIHRKRRGHCLELLLEEEKLYPGTGLIGEVGKLCKMYGIPDVSYIKLEKDFIKQKIWSFGRAEIWKESTKNRRVPMEFSHMSKGNRHNYMQLPKYDSRLFFTYKIGELQFKEFRKGEFIKKYGNTNCFQPGCQSKDNLTHVMRCHQYENKFYETQIDSDENKMKLFIDYLKRLDKERAERFNLPIMYRRLTKRENSKIKLHVITK